MEAGIAAQQAVFRQNMALSVMKQASGMEKALANMVEQVAQSVPTGSRGSVVNISA